MASHGEGGGAADLLKLSESLRIRLSGVTSLPILDFLLDPDRMLAKPTTEYQYVNTLESSVNMTSGMMSSVTFFQGLVTIREIHFRRSRQLIFWRVSVYDSSERLQHIIKEGHVALVGHFQF